MCCSTSERKIDGGGAERANGHSCFSIDFCCRRCYHPKLNFAHVMNNCRGEFSHVCRRELPYHKTEYSFVDRPSELKPLQCNVLLLCQSQEKRICEVSLFFSNVFENFLSRNNALCDLSKVCQLRSRRLPKPRISTVFRRAQMNPSSLKLTAAL